MYCTQCGSELLTDAKFCHKCGTPVGHMQQSTISAIEESPTITEFPETSATLSGVDCAQQNTVDTTPAAITEEKAENLYEAVIGENNRTYYLSKFNQFDQQAPGLNPSWNWSAFFVGGTWALYRKMYGWFFAFLGIMLISGFIEKEGSTVIGFIVLFAPWVAFTVFANSLYHGNVKKKIAAVKLSTTGKSKLVEVLQHRGGVHRWVIWVCILLFITGILVAIAIPQLAAYKSKQSLPITEAPATHATDNYQPKVEAAATPAPSSIDYVHQNRLRDLETYNEAIRLKPDDAISYNKRGGIYHELGQYQRAIKDYTKAILLKPDYAEAYAGRGGVYDLIEQYQRAVKDYTKAILLKPDYAKAYASRGGVYLLQGKKNLGCLDAHTGCRLGDCSTLEWDKQYGKYDCR